MAMWKDLSALEIGLGQIFWMALEYSLGQAIQNDPAFAEDDHTGVLLDYFTGIPVFFGAPQ